MSESLLSPRDWSVVEAQFKQTTPYNYAVIENFLDANSCESLRHKLCNHWNWRHKNWTSKHLHNDQPNIPEIFEIAKTLKIACPQIFNGLELFTYWALMYNKNSPGKVHSDRGGVTVSVWLTPEKYNRNPANGGLVFYDVKRSVENLQIPADKIDTWMEEFVAEHTQGRTAVGPYKYNCALIFDADTFHKTDELDFDFSEPESVRINLGLAFADPNRNDHITEANFVANEK